MKKIILSLALFAMVSLNVNAQTDEYKQRTKELLELGTSSYSPKQMKSSIMEMMQTTLSSVFSMTGQTNEQSDQMMGVIENALGDYLTGDEFLNDLTDAITPVYEKNFTLEEMDQIIAKYNSPEGKKVRENCSGNLGSLTSTVSKVMGPITTIAMGGEAPAIEHVDCPQEYREAFNKYFELSSGCVIKQMNEQMGSGEDEKALRLKKYIMEALPEMALSTVYQSMTLDQLKEATTFISDPLIQRYIKASSTMDKEVMESISQKVTAKMTQGLGSLFGGMGQSE